MPSITIRGINVVFDDSERDTAKLISDTATQTLQLVEESWGVKRLENCQIYIMTSWWGFIFQSAPWLWRILLAGTFPIWCFRAKRIWPYSAGWTQSYGRRIAIGIKPPYLLETSNKSIGKYMFEEEKDPKSKISHLTCHELTHACSAYLKLPAWLNEGLAEVTVDRFMGKRTIRLDTLKLIRNYLPKGKPPTYRQISRMGGQTFAYHVVRGYWFVQYLEERHTGFLKRLFSFWHGASTLDTVISQEMGIEPESLWIQIDDILISHFDKIRGD